MFRPFSAETFPPHFFQFFSSALVVNRFEGTLRKCPVSIFHPFSALYRKRLTPFSRKSNHYSQLFALKTPDFMTPNVPLGTASEFTPQSVLNSKLSCQVPYKTLKRLRPKDCEVRSSSNIAIQREEAMNCFRWVLWKNLLLDNKATTRPGLHRLYFLEGVLRAAEIRYRTPSSLCLILRHKRNDDC